jgi:hypothetical protein
MIGAVELVLKDNSFIIAGAKAKDVRFKLYIDMLKRRSQMKNVTLKYSHIMMFLNIYRTGA